MRHKCSIEIYLSNDDYLDIFLKEYKVEIPCKFGQNKQKADTHAMCSFHKFQNFFFSPQKIYL